MKTGKTGIILEGGAMRGIYTAGALDALMEQGVTADGVIGVSAGAVHGCSYVSGQKGRSIRYYLKYMKDPRFMSFRSFIRTGNLVDTQFCYHELPEKLDRFDYDAFADSGMEFYVVCTNVETGNAEYIRIRDMHEIEYVQASASMPLVSRMVEIGGKKFLDGGVADSIPVRAFRKMGYERNLVILTRPKGYQKRPARMQLFRRTYRKYPEFLKAVEQRYLRYNQTLELIEKLEKQGELLVIRPRRDLKMGRMEKRPEKVQEAYLMGYQDAMIRTEEIRSFLAGGKKDGSL